MRLTLDRAERIWSVAEHNVHVFHAEARETGFGAFHNMLAAETAGVGRSILGVLEGREEQKPGLLAGLAAEA